MFRVFRQVMPRDLQIARFLRYLAGLASLPRIKKFSLTRPCRHPPIHLPQAVFANMSEAGEDRVVGGTWRPDGTVRKERRIRPGYTPQDEQPTYSSAGRQVWVGGLFSAGIWAPHASIHQHREHHRAPPCSALLFSAVHCIAVGGERAQVPGAGRCSSR